MAETKYQIEQIKSIDSEELASFCILYAPLMEPLSYQFYLLMSGILESHGRIKNHRFFCETLHCTLPELTQAREELERFMLLKTFYNSEQNALILQLQPIKRGFKFLNHEVLGRYYLMKMGSKAYQFAMLCFKDPALSLDGYENISVPFNAATLSGWKSEEEEEFQTNRYLREKKKGSFDISKFLKKCSKLVFPGKERNKANLEVIEEMGNYYHISIEEMIEFVGKATPSRTMEFNANRFKELVRKKYLPLQEEKEEGYEMRPVRFLQKKQNGVALSSVDAQLLEDLSNKFKLKDEVINIMIEYILNNNENRLDRKYVEKIASVWVRNQVDTAEKAFEACKPKEKKKFLKKTEERKLPEWYINNENEQEEEASEEMLAQFNELLEGLENK